MFNFNRKTSEIDELLKAIKDSDVDQVKLLMNNNSRIHSQLRLLTDKIVAHTLNSFGGTEQQENNRKKMFFFLINIRDEKNNIVLDQRYMFECFIDSYQISRERLQSWLEPMLRVDQDQLAAMLQTRPNQISILKKIVMCDANELLNPLISLTNSDGSKVIDVNEISRGDALLDVCEQMLSQLRELHQSGTHTHITAETISQASQQLSFLQQSGGRSFSQSETQLNKLDWRLVALQRRFLMAQRALISSDRTYLDRLSSSNQRYLGNWENYAFLRHSFSPLPLLRSTEKIQELLRQIFPGMPPPSSPKNISQVLAEAEIVYRNFNDAEAIAQLFVRIAFNVSSSNGRDTLIKILQCINRVNLENYSDIFSKVREIKAIISVDEEEAHFYQDKSIFTTLKLAANSAELLSTRLPPAQLIETDEMLSLFKTDALEMVYASLIDQTNIHALYSTLKDRIARPENLSDSNNVVLLYQTYVMLAALGGIIHLIRQMQINYKGNNPYKARCFQSINAAISSIQLETNYTANDIYAIITSVVLTVKSEAEELSAAPGHGRNLLTFLRTILITIDDVWPKTYLTQCVEEKEVYPSCGISCLCILPNEAFTLLTTNVSYDVYYIAQWLLEPLAFMDVELPQNPGQQNFTVNRFLDEMLDNYKTPCVNPCTSLPIIQEEKIALLMKLVLIKIQESEQEENSGISFNYIPDYHYRNPTCEQFSKWPLTAPEEKESQLNLVNYINETLSKNKNDDYHSSQQYLAAYAVAVLAKELIKIQNTTHQPVQNNFPWSQTITTLTQNLMSAVFYSKYYTAGRNLAILNLHGALPIEQRNSYVTFIEDILVRRRNLMTEIPQALRESYIAANVELQETLNTRIIVLSTTVTMYQGADSNTNGNINNPPSPG